MDINENKQTEGNGTEGTDLLALAMRADAGEIDPEVPVAEPAAESPTAESDKSKKPEEKEKEKSGTEPKEKTEQKDDPEKGPETKPTDDSKYAKARKEQERQDRSWKKLEEEKAALKTEREKLEEERKQTLGEKSKVKIHRDAQGYSADDYEAFSKTTEDPELAERAKERAAQLRKEEGETKTNAAREDFEKGWNENLNKVLDQDPELKDETSEIGKALSGVLKDRLCFSMTPDGILHAYEFAKAQRQAGLVSGLQEENQKLKDEIDRLNKLTGLSGSGPTKKPIVKSLDEMSGEERGAELQRMAEEADRAG